MEVGIFFIVLMLLAAGAYYSYLSQQKRLTALGAVADGLGWQFQPGDDYDHEDQFAQFDVFSQGQSRYAYNTLLGSIELGGAAWPVKMGDYHYQTTSHNGEQTTTHTHIFSYLALRLPYPTPDLLVRREGMFDAVKNLFGFDDIDFESAEFSRRFCVKCPERKFAYDVIHPRMIEFLMEYEPPAIHIREGACLIGDGQSTWTPEEFRATVDWVQHFFELWPGFVVEKLAHASQDQPLEKSP